MAATTALLLTGCGKAASSRQDISPQPLTNATGSPFEAASAPSPALGASSATTERPETIPSSQASPAENQLVVALEQYAVADENARTDIEEHLGDLAEQGVDKKDIARALVSMFAIEKSPPIKMSILDELEALGAQYVFDQALAATASNETLEVRDEAISILQDLGDKRAISTLQPLLMDPDEVIREEAQDAINTLNSRPAP